MKWGDFYLKNGTVLIIMPFYFEYERVIRTALEKHNFDVYTVDENIDEFSLFHHCIYLYTNMLKNIIVTRYYSSRIKKVDKSIDYVLIINGRTLTISILNYLKNRFAQSKFVMYQWDSVKKVAHAILISKYCNSNYTFDSIDSKEFNWIYRPLFFDVSDYHSNTRNYDITFICSLHSQRVSILDKIETYVQENNLHLFSYIYAEKWSFIRQKYLKNNSLFQIDKKRIKFKKLSLSETNAIYDQSFAILDYKFPEQNGLTMRSIEALGHRCKLITNNRNIINEPFYNPNNIYIYDYEDVEKNGFNIPPEFFSTPYQDVPEDILYRYTIDGWIDDIFGKQQEQL